MSKNSKHPKFGWSWSRDGRLSECARKYLLTDYRAAGLRSPPDAARLAYRLKKLTNLHLQLGQLADTEARLCTAAALAGKPLPKASAVAERLRSGLRLLCMSATIQFEKFLKDPRSTPMLRSIYYDGAWDAREVNAVTAKIPRVSHNLVSSRLWEEIRGLDPRSVITYRETQQIWHEEFGLIYGAPDLVALGDGTGEIVDFKSGQVGDARHQIALYSWFMLRLLDVPFHERVWTGRVIGLDDGTDERFEITERTLTGVEERIRRSIEWMVELMEDPTINKPRPPEAFPLPRIDLRPRLCPTCPMRELCEPELQREGGAGLPRPLWRAMPKQ